MWSPKHLTIEQKEERRLSAVTLLESGAVSHSEIARKLGVSRQIVSRWAQQLRATSDASSLRSRPHRGRPAHLSAEKWQEVLTILQGGGQSSGFDTDRWTLNRIAQLIHDQFGVRYNAHYLGERLHSLGWSVQVPAVTARERDEELVQAWLHGDWPRILKKRGAWGRKSPSSTRSASRF